ncbi:MAG: serine hydrolase [Patescibacteria group bacterium]
MSSLVKKIFLCGLIAAAAIGGYMIGRSKPDVLTPLVVRTNDDDLKFISPLVVFTIGDKSNYPEYKSFEQKVQDYISTAKSEGKATNVSVYFRDLVNESWAGINEDEKYAPSSMLKVSVMMAYFKNAETHPEILKTLSLYKPEIDPGQTYKPVDSLSSGYHTNLELIEQMIKESDNSAADILFSNQKDAMLKVFQDLHLPQEKDPNDIDFMSARLYSRLFRTLYNGSYLTHDLSNSALKLLSETDFNDGLVKGVPAGVTVAHKFGERTVKENPLAGDSEYRELHDCGIIYHSQTPYFLCVMTKGHEFIDLESIIADISAIVYADVDQRTQAK